MTGINPVPAVGPLLTPLGRLYVPAGGGGLIAGIRPIPTVDGLPALPVPVVWVSEWPDRVTLEFVAAVRAVMEFLMIRSTSFSPEGFP